MIRIKKELVFLTVVCTIALVGLLQLFHEEAYACPAMCASGPLSCNCYWSSGMESLEDKCYAHATILTCQTCSECTVNCTTWCYRFTSEQSCENTVLDCDPD